MRCITSWAAPSREPRKEDHSTTPPGKTLWGFQNGVKKGTDERSSVLGKIEYKPNADVAITGDVYLARSNILEPTMVHVAGNTGNWDGWQMADYSKVRTAGGYVTGVTVNNVQRDNLNARWKQDMTNFTTGLTAWLARLPIR